MRRHVLLKRTFFSDDAAGEAPIVVRWYLLLPKGVVAQEPVEFSVPVVVGVWLGKGVAALERDMSAPLLRGQQQP